MKIPLTKRPEAGLTLLELIVVLAVIAILVGLLFPARNRPYSMPPRIACYSDLKQDALALRLFAGDNDGKYPAQAILTNDGDFEKLGNDLPKYLFTVMSNELSTTKVLNCPADTRPAASNFASLQTSNISYFITLDASDTNTTGIILGDRNLQLNGTNIRTGIFTLYTNSTMTWAKTIHKYAGNVAMADGSVSQATSSQLQNLTSNQGLPTNRLAFP